MDTQKILGRITDPGFLMLVAGAIITYGSGFIARKLFQRHENTASLVIKAVGCVLVLIGAVLLFT